MAPHSRVKQAVSEGLEAGGTRFCVVQPGIVIQITRFFLPAHRLITKMKMLRGGNFQRSKALGDIVGIWQLAFGPRSCAFDRSLHMRT